MLISMLIYNFVVYFNKIQLLIKFMIKIFNKKIIKRMKL